MDGGGRLRLGMLVHGVVVKIGFLGFELRNSFCVACAFSWLDPYNQKTDVEILNSILPQLVSSPKYEYYIISNENHFMLVG